MQMVFRFWAFRRWVFPDELSGHPDAAVEAALTGGGIAEVMEDEYEARHPGPENVTPLRRP